METNSSLPRLFLAAAIACSFIFALPALARTAARPIKETRTTGVVTVLLKVKYKTGLVSKLKLLQSSGNPELDQAAVASLRQRTYPPRTVRKPLRIQTAFTLTRRSKALPVRKALAVEAKTRPSPGRRGKRASASPREAARPDAKAKVVAR